MKKITIGKLGQIVGGATPSTKDATLWGGDIAWITPKDLSGLQGRFIEIGQRSITCKGLSSCSASLLPRGSVLFSSRAPIGYVAIAAAELCTNQGFKSIIPNENIDGMYLYYLMKYMSGFIAAMGAGTTFKEISGKALSEIEVQIPETRETQAAIASVLDAIDSKIELNSRINDHLLELANAMFDRSIEAGSCVIPLGKIIQLEDALRIPLNRQQREQRRGVYPYYGAASIMDYVNDYLFDGVRLLLGEDGTVSTDGGYPMLQYVWGKYWVNNHAHVIRSSSTYSLETIYLALRKTPIAPATTGAVQKKISQTNLKKLMVKMPTSFDDDKCSTIFAEMRSIIDETERLENLRDALLPKLMSGEIDVSQVDLTQLNGHLSENSISI